MGAHEITAPNDLIARTAASRPDSPAELAGSPASAAAAAAGDEVEAILRAPAPQRRDRLEALVRGCAAHVMQLDPAAGPGPRERFTDLGLDSLMALQLSGDIEKALHLEGRVPSTIAFDTGTVEALTARLLAILTTAPAHTPQTATPVDVSSGPRLTAEDLAGYSDEQVELLLAQRIPGERAVADA